MENKIIAVEEQLVQYKNALEQAGFRTVQMSKSQGWQDADMLVVSGMSENLMGMQDTMTKAPVIKASGLTAEDVVRIATERLS